MMLYSHIPNMETTILQLEILKLYSCYILYHINTFLFILFYLNKDGEYKIFYIFINYFIIALLATIIIVVINENKIKQQQKDEYKMFAGFGEHKHISN